MIDIAYLINTAQVMWGRLLTKLIHVWHFDLIPVERAWLLFTHLTSQSSNYFFFSHLDYFLWIHYCNVRLMNAFNVPWCHRCCYVSWTACQRQWPLIQTALLTLNYSLTTNPVPLTLDLHPHCKFCWVPPLEAPSCFKIWRSGGLCSISRPGQARDKWGVWSWAQLLTLCNCHHRAYANVRTLLINQRSRLCQPTLLTQC